MFFSEVLQGVFCPEIFFEWDDQYFFCLFSKLSSVLKKIGSLSVDDSNAGAEEFTTCVVDVRSRHSPSSRSAEEIPDVISYLLSDKRILSRRLSSGIFKVCCFVFFRPRKSHPAVTFGLGGCRVPAGFISSCIQATRSNVLSPTHKQGVFFTEGIGRPYVRPLVMFAFLCLHLRLTHRKVCCVMTLWFSSSANCLPPIWLENGKIRISGCMTIIAVAKNWIPWLSWIRRLLLAPLLVLSLPSCCLPCRQLEGDNR